jgi:hypothetical protein
VDEKKDAAPGLVHDAELRNEERGKPLGGEDSKGVLPDGGRLYGGQGGI